MNRIRLDLPKTHYFDACCVGESTTNHLYFKTKEVLFIKAKGRGSRSRTNLDRYGFPRGYLARQNSSLVFKQGTWLRLLSQEGNIKAFGLAKSHVERLEVSILKARTESVSHKE